MTAADTAPAAREALLKDFEANRAPFLTRLRNQFPVHYARLIALVMSRDAEPKSAKSDDESRDFMTWNLEERARAYRAIKRECEKEDHPTEGLARIRLIMTGEYYDFDESEWVQLGAGDSED